jgi:hypothetical protein
MCASAGVQHAHLSSRSSSAAQTALSGMRTPTVWRCLRRCLLDLPLLITSFGIALLAARMNVYAPGSSLRTTLNVSGWPA